MWNSMRELPLSGSSASVAVMVSTVCPTGVSSARVWLPYCTQTNTDRETWRSNQHEKQQASSMTSSDTHIVLLEHRHLIVDVNDLDDDFTICAETCETEAVSATALCEKWHTSSHRCISEWNTCECYLGHWLWQQSYRSAGLFGAASVKSEFLQMKSRWWGSWMC